MSISSINSQFTRMPEDDTPPSEPNMDEPNNEEENIEELMDEMTGFYSKMVDKLKGLRFADEEVEDRADADSDEDGVLGEVLAAIEKKRKDPRIQKQIQKIMQMDEEIESSFQILKQEKLERQSLQLEEEDTSKIMSREADCKMQQRLSKATLLQSGDNKFIRRNIDLAKNTVMPCTFSMTDEEKAKLELLLRDADDDDVEIDEDAECREVVEGEDDFLERYGGFLLEDLDRTRLEEIDARLANFSESDSNATPVSREVPEKEDIDKDDQDGKHWKNAKRLSVIDAKLQCYQLQKEEDDNRKPVDVPPELLDESFEGCLSPSERIEPSLIESYLKSLDIEPVGSDNE